MQLLRTLHLGGRRQLPIVLQAEYSECSLACLAMVAAYHGQQESLLSLRERFQTSQQGVNLQHLMKMAGRFCLTTRALRCEIDEIYKLELPVIIHWDFNHFVVVARASRTSITIHDPALGQRKYSLSAAAHHFTGIALELSPDAQFKASDSRAKLSLRQFLGNLPGMVPILAQILFLSVILQFVALASPFYMQLVVDDVLVKQDVDLLILLATGFLAITLISLITQAIRGWTSIYLTNQLSLKFGSRLFHRLLSLKGDYFMKRHLGDIVSRFTSLRPVQEFLTSSAITVLLDSVMALSTLTMILIYSPLLAGVVVLALLLYLASQMAFYLPTRDRSHEQITANAKLDSNFMESIRSINAIKRFGAEQQRESEWQNRFNEVINANIRLSWLSLARDVLNNGISGISQILVIFLGAKQVLSGHMSIGMLYAFMAYRSHLVSAATSLVNELIRFLMLSLHLERLSDIQLAATDTPRSMQAAPAISGRIRLDGVGFRHTDDQPWILQHIELDIQPADRLCILGPSGCGKSTLLNVMQNLLPATHGEIYIDELPLSGAGGHALSTHSASVMQGEALLSGSIQSNIAFNDPEFDYERVESAARLAMIHDDIMAMAMGYESLIGDMGTILSAGQQSRVLIARALYHRPKILFLDECTAHLDEATEAQVMQSIIDLKITCIFVTHNTRLARQATAVLLLTPSGYQLVSGNP
ncbi:MAG: peptidase domain-containing ABC transporter [SAR86 cluster bacterium]|jgi:ATP-binding cassette, subfamily B, bacterial CvaB/MchF/RaxB